MHQSAVKARFKQKSDQVTLTNEKGNRCHSEMAQKAIEHNVNKMTTIKEYCQNKQKANEEKANTASWTL